MTAESSLEFMNRYIASTQNSRNKVYLTNKEISTLQNAVYNIFFNGSIKLSEQENRYFKKRAKLLKVLASKKTSLVEKRKIADENRGLIRRIAEIVVTYLNGD